MIVNVNFDSEELIKEIELNFSDVYKHKDELKNEYKYNPYLKLYVFIENNEILGIIDISDIYDRYEINNIYVKKEYRNKKIATRLLEKIITDAKSNNKVNITLEVRNNNFSALNLYKKHGFIEKSVRKGYYNGIDGILMEKEMM